MAAPRIPSPGSIRAMYDQLRSGVSADQLETIEELLASARKRITSALPAEALALLETLDPALLESYALLRQPVVGEIRENQQPETMPETSTPPPPPQPGPQASSPAIAARSHSLTFPDDGDGVSVTFTASNPTEQALLDALSGLQAQAGSQVSRGQSLWVVPPVMLTMALDAFQNAYHGQVEIKTGTKRRPQIQHGVIAVIREVYEAERDRVGLATVKDPAYWLDKLNYMSVYLLEDLDHLEVGWILGDYDPVSSGVPAGIKATPEQIAGYLMAGVDDEEWPIRVIKMHLRTEEQRAWLAVQDYGIEDILSNRTHSEPEIEAMYDDWNNKLGIKVFGY